MWAMHGIIVYATSWSMTEDDGDGNGGGREGMRRARGSEYKNEVGRWSRLRQGRWRRRGSFSRKRARLLTRIFFNLRIFILTARSEFLIETSGFLFRTKIVTYT